MTTEKTLQEKRFEFNRMKPSLWRELPQECANCGATEELHLHHVVALSRGGANKKSNIVPLCEICHGLAHWGLDNGKPKRMNVSKRMKRYDITKEQLQRFSNARMTSQEMADFYGCSIQNITYKLACYGISKKAGSGGYAKNNFISWLKEFALEEAGSSIKMKKVYSEVLEISQSHFKRLKKDPEIIDLMIQLNIELKGQSIVKG